MDIKCPKCGEPWENDSLHEYAEEAGSTYAQVAKTFRVKGCGTAFAGWGVSTCVADGKSELRNALADLLGDDMDGYAAMCEDFAL